MNAIQVYRHPQARQMVVDLEPQFPERGKIKIGKLGEKRRTRSGDGEYQMPVKLDHFIVTTLERGPDNNFVRDEQIHKLLGDRPTEMPIRLIFDDISMNLQTRYVAFKGKKVWCQGNGETAVRDGQQRACPCPNRERGFQASQHNPVCKINGRLQVMIDHAESVGGVWVLRTTSRHTVRGLVSSMQLIQQLTAGRLAGVPLTLSVQPQIGHDDQDRPTTIYVVRIEYRGTIESLRDRAYQAALADAQQGERYAHAIEDARRMLAAPVVSDDEETDIQAEFYPEEIEDVLHEGPPATNPPPDDDIVLVYDLAGQEMELPAGQEDWWIEQQMKLATSRAECERLADSNPDLAARIAFACPFPAEPAPPPPEPPAKPIRQPLRMLDEHGVPVPGRIGGASQWIDAYRALIAKAADKAAFARNNISLLRKIAVQFPDMSGADLEAAEAMVGDAGEESGQGSAEG